MVLPGRLCRGRGTLPCPGADLWRPVHGWRPQEAIRQQLAARVDTWRCRVLLPPDAAPLSCPARHGCDPVRGPRRGTCPGPRPGTADPSCAKPRCPQPVPFAGRRATAASCAAIAASSSAGTAAARGCGATRAGAGRARAGPVARRPAPRRVHGHARSARPRRTHGGAPWADWGRAARSHRAGRGRRYRSHRGPPCRRPRRHEGDPAGAGQPGRGGAGPSLRHAGRRRVPARVRSAFHERPALAVALDSDPGGRSHRARPAAGHRLEAFLGGAGGPARGVAHTAPAAPHPHDAGTLGAGPDRG